MTKRKLMALLMTLVMVVSLFTACGSKEEAPADAPAEEAEEEAPAEEPATDKKPVLGFLPSAMTSNFFIYTSEGAKAVAEANGYELMIQSPPSEDDYAAAVSIMEDMITQGVAAIMLCTNSQESLAPAVEKANAAGIPVVLFNTTTEFDPALGVEIYAYCGYDQYAGCGMVADWLNEYTNGEAVVGVIEGLPSYYTLERAGGFVDTITEKYADGLKIVATAPGDWETEVAMNATMDIIQANPDINVVFTCSDPMAQGAWAACEQLGREDVIVTGVDGNPDVLESIQSGKITATLNANPVGMGANAAQACIDAINGVARDDKIILSEINVIDPSNVADYIKE